MVQALLCKSVVLIAVAAWCAVAGVNASAAPPAARDAGGSETVDIEGLDSVLQSMVEELYEKAAKSGAKGVQTKYIRFEGIGWESPDGDVAGTGAIGTLLGKRVEIALSNKSTVLSPEDSDRAKGFFGTIVRGTYKVGRAGVSIVLRMVDRSSGSVLSEVSRELGVNTFPGVARRDLLPPASGEAQALGGLISRALGGASSDFAVRVSTDQGSYGSYVEGENLTVILESEKDCYVRVYHVSWEERVMTLIFPNRSEQDGVLKAGEVRRVPGASQDYAFEVTKPYGVDAIFAVASLKPFGDEEELRAGWSRDTGHADGGGRESGSEPGDTGSEGSQEAQGDTEWEEEEPWWETEDIDWVDGYVVESNIDEDRVEEVMAKGLIITKKKHTGASGGLEWAESSPLTNALDGAGEQGTARATCYFITVQKLF